MAQALETAPGRAQAAHSLPPAPVRLLDEAGNPTAGAFAGTIADARFRGLAPPWSANLLSRWLTGKRWQYALVTTPQAMLAVAVIDLGYLSSGICALFDRGARRLLFDAAPILPLGCARVSEAPGVGARAELFGPGVSARIERNGDHIALAARVGRAEVEALLDASAALPALSVVSPLPRGRFAFTQKLVGLTATGEVRFGSSRVGLDGGSAALDYTHGLFPRETRWRWAFASGLCGGRRVGFNLASGLHEGGSLPGESAVWVEGGPAGVGPVEIRFDLEDPLLPWTISASPGGLSLRFVPEGLRAQDTDLRLVSSRYLQPFGAFFGHLTSAEGERVVIDGLAGIVEDHRARW